MDEGILHLALGTCIEVVALNPTCLAFTSKVTLTDHASHDSSNAFGEREQMCDGGGIEQAVGHLALRRHDRRIRAAQRYRCQTTLVYRFQGVLCNTVLNNIRNNCHM